MVYMYYYCIISNIITTLCCKPDGPHVQAGLRWDKCFECAIDLGIVALHTLTQGQGPLVCLGAPSDPAHAAAFLKLLIDTQQVAPQPGAAQPGEMLQGAAQQGAAQQGGLQQGAVHHRVNKLRCCALSDGTDLVFVGVHGEHALRAAGASLGTGPVYP